MGKEKTYRIKRIKNKAYIEQLGERIITIRAKTIVNLQKAIESMLNEEAKALLYEAFIDAGIDTAKILHKKWKIKKERELIKKFIEFYDSRGCGWFKIKKIDIDFETFNGNIQIEQSFIAEEYGKSDKPVCDLLSGYFAGVFKEVFKKILHAKKRNAFQKEILIANSISKLFKGLITLK